MLVDTVKAGKEGAGPVERDEVDVVTPMLP